MMLHSAASAATVGHVRCACVDIVGTFCACGEDVLEPPCNDDGLGCAGFTSELVTEVVAGTTYIIQVGGFNPPASGPGNLTICEGDACLAGCVASCEKSDVPEEEGCGGDTSGGCNDASGNGPVQQINVGDTVCGTMFAFGGTRDTDWYEFTISERSRISWTVEANIPTTLFLLSSDCPPTIQIGAGYDACPANHTGRADAARW